MLSRTEREGHIAAGMLLLGTVFWGCGFTWAKEAISEINLTAGQPIDSWFGASLSLLVRFIVAAILWPILFPASCRGWTVRSAIRCLGVGLLLGISLVVQHVGLERTSESVSAFLTSLTVLFVPIFVTVVARRPPRGILWLGVALATAGVWLMTGAQPTGFGAGEWLGLGCSAGFSAYILAVNAAARRESAPRLALGQFVVVVGVCLVAVLALPGGRTLADPHLLWRAVSAGKAGINLLLLSVLTTLAAFGLLTFFQPRIEPTRATIIYLMEPVIAAVYASIAAGHGLGKIAIIGSGLILAANLLVEILSSRQEKTG